MQEVLARSNDRKYAQEEHTGWNTQDEQAGSARKKCSQEKHTRSARKNDTLHPLRITETSKPSITSRKKGMSCSHQHDVDIPF